MYSTLRLLHIISGIFVGGTYLFMVPILEPRLRRLGPAIQGPVMSAIAPALTPVMGLCFIVLFGTGTAMTLTLRQGSLSDMVTTVWGWDIVIGIVATVAAAVVGFGMITPAGIRMGKLSRSIVNRPPKPEEAQQLQQLSKRIESLTRINFIFVLATLATMLAARFL